MKRIVARWQDWAGSGLEHLVLTLGPEGAVADAVVVGSSEGTDFGVRYRVVCDTQWRTRHVEVHIVGRPGPLVLVSDGMGRWCDHEGSALPSLDGAIDVDLSVTAFTNTLPIRRLGLARGEAREILAVYIRIPDATVETDGQRYTCLDGAGRYRYEAVDGTFARDIDVDEHGLVVTYPDLFRRIS